MRTPAKRIIGPALLTILIAALLIRLPLAIADRASGYEFMDLVIDVRSILQSKFVREVPDDQLRAGALRGILETVDDPYTVYVPPSDQDEFNKDLRGEYVGIGAEVNIINDYLTIVTPMDDSPALEAGVMAGDVVLEIEGESTFQLSIDDCIERLMGEPGTQVTIRVRHLDETESDLTVTRRQIVTPTVKGLRRNGSDWNYCVSAEHGLAYARVTQFNAATVVELRTALETLLAANRLGGLVLDLRDNPGGSLGSAVHMSDLFLAEGAIVAYNPRDGGGRSWSAERADTLPDFPMVVLVNERSASASEIVAGALQAHGRARVLGTRTFGKGSVQEVQELPYGNGTLKYTTAYYELPTGRSIQRRTESDEWGVDPDRGLVVTMTDEEYVEMFRARRDYEIIRDAEAGADECVDPAWIREHIHDEQLARAVEILTVRTATGDWPASDADDPALVAFNQELVRAADRRNRLLESLAQLEERIANLQKKTDEHAGSRETLLPEGAEVEDATLMLRDRDGNAIGTFRIRGGNVELALRALQVERVSDE